MTRKEQIKEAARQRANQYDHPVQWNDTYHGFISGAEWADEYPIHYDGKAMLHVLKKGYEQGYRDAIDKSRKFFEKRMWEMKAPDGEAYVVDGISSSISEFIRNFKEYMEEQQ